MGLLKTKRDGKLVAYRLDKPAVIVGSGENCNIRVDDSGAVARHCQILKMENGFVLRDMSGEVGTFVNGKKVKEHLLSDRDLIQVGKERFTFSLSEGENTARVAVSVAPGTAAAPAKSGNTGRVAAAAPARSGNTGRMPAPATASVPKSGNTGRIAAPAPAAAEGSGRSTQRVNKTTQRTAAAQKTTGRIEGGTKKITARSAAAMGYSTQKTTFAMPSTKKGKMIAIGGVLLIAAIGGILYGISAAKVNPEAIKQTMAKQMDELRKFKPDQVIEIDNGYEAILAEHLPVRPYVNQLYTNIEKEHIKVHQIASDLKKAAKEVKPFLDSYAALKAKGENKQPKAQTLYDEAKSLNDSYGNTVFGTQLQAILKELQDILSVTGPSWESEIVALQREVQVNVKKGDCATALKAVNDFGVKHNDKEKLQLFNKLKEEREMISRQSDAFVKREVEKATKDLGAEGAKKDEIKKRLVGFKAGLEGYPAALEKLEAAIAAIK